MEPLLSICIPTYNRSLKLEKLLYFLDSEVKKIDINKIEILIGNNNSTDDTEEIILNFTKKIKPAYSFRYYKNEINLGLVGNLFELCKKSTGTYIWWVGDDDLYHADIVRTVLETLNKKDYSFIFINHCGYKNNINDNTGFKTAINNVDCLKETKDVLLDIYENSGTTLMYISATIHKRSNILQFLEEKHTINLATPFYLSFYSGSKGPTKIIPEILIDNVWGDTSWSDKSIQVFCFQVPKVLWEIIRLGYSHKRIIKNLLKIIWQHKNIYIKSFIGK